MNFDFILQSLHLCSFTNISFFSLLLSYSHYFTLIRCMCTEWNFFFGTSFSLHTNFLWITLNLTFLPFNMVSSNFVNMGFIEQNLLLAILVLFFLLFLFSFSPNYSLANILITILRSVTFIIYINLILNYIFSHVSKLFLLLRTLFFSIASF